MLHQGLGLRNQKTPLSQPVKNKLCGEHEGFWGAEPTQNNVKVGFEKMGNCQIKYEPLHSNLLEVLNQNNRVKQSTLPC